MLAITKFSFLCNVEMSYKPERELTRISLATKVFNFIGVEMSYKPKRALTH